MRPYRYDIVGSFLRPDYLKDARAEYAEGTLSADQLREVEETVEAREQTVEWEMRQLGIMDWITNDVDWMTGDVHADVKRLAWHN